MRTLIDHVTVLTMDGERRVLKDGYVLVKDQEIEEIGDGKRPVAYEEYIDGEQGILMPGMVNVHSHIPMIPFRSMGDDCPDRLRRFLFPLEQEAMTEGLIYLASKYAVCELLLAGVTTVLDMYYFEDEVAKACEELGIRAYLGETIINMKTCDSEEPYGGLEIGEKFIKKWAGKELITPLVSSHATNTSSPEMLKEAFALAERNQCLYTLHASEMDYEIAYFRESYHKTPIDFLYDEGLLDRRVIAAHCIHMANRDLELLAETGTRVAHCIGSNTKAGKGISPVAEMVKQGIVVGLGTDGPSSGNTLDLFTQFRLFASFQKTKYGDRKLFPAEEIVELGTMGGAKVLHAEKQIGSIEVGKRADLVLVETRSANMFPVYNPYSALVYSANQSNVDTVFVNGKLVVRKKQIVNASLVSLREELERAMTAFTSMAEKYKDII